MLARYAEKLNGNSYLPLLSPLIEVVYIIRKFQILLRPLLR